MTTPLTYREGSRMAIPATLAIGLLATTLLLFFMLRAPVSALLGGRQVTTGDTVTIFVMVVAIVTEVVGIRVIGRIDVPISMAPGVVHFPRKGTWNVIFRRTVAVPMTHIAEVDVNWETWPVHGGNSEWSVSKIVVRTLDGSVYSKMYPIYSLWYQQWAEETVSQFEGFLGKKVRHLSARTGKPVLDGRPTKAPVATRLT